MSEEVLGAFSSDLGEIGTVGFSNIKFKKNIFLRVRFSAFLLTI